MVAGLVCLVASGILWRRHAPQLAEIEANSVALADSSRRVHDELVHQSLLLKGLTNSVSSLPDTVKRYGAGKMMETTTAYDKAIRKLEMTERDIRIDMAALKRDRESERRSARNSALPCAAAGIAAFLIGLVLTAFPSRRVGA